MRHKFLEVCACCVAMAMSANAVTPSILSAPQSITVNNASAGVFSVVASNAAGYQWQFQGTNLAGATNATLSLDDVATNQAGTYTVVVTSSDDLSTNASAVLTIVPGTIVQFAITGYPGGATNYLSVQLFDHDKPATVENFVHYITSGAYTNLFWSRCVPGFIIQGGDYAAEDRTNTSLLSYSIYQNFTLNLTNTPYFPWQVDNEYDVGPLIHNRFGTVAMAKQSGAPDSATSAFFFNLADNSTNLDNQNDGFTVFGRILSGTNVLEYFNGLSKPTNGVYDSGVAPYTDLPINFKSADLPGDTNLFFVDFTFITQPTVDTNIPTVAITYPGNGATATNAEVVVQGTAHDDIGLARVVCNFYDTFGYAGDAFGGNAVGTTNWSYDAGGLPPGSYSAVIVSQDGAGNLSSNAISSFVVPRFPFNAYTNGPGKISRTVMDGTNTAIGTAFKVNAIPDKGAEFVNWTTGSTLFLSPKESFDMANGLQLTANFISNTIPGGISFTSPSPNAKLTNPVVRVEGKIAEKVGSATVTCQFFEASGISLGSPIVVSGTNTWALAPILFGPGQYTVQAVARDSSGRSTVISEEFSILTPLTVVTQGPGRASIANGAYEMSGKKYTIKATPKMGSLFYEWTDGTSYWDNPTQTFTNSEGLTFTATFVDNALPNSIAFTSPGSEVLTNDFNLTGTIASTVVGPQVTCQLFLKNEATKAALPATINGTTWSLAVSNLQQGNYTAIAVVTDSEGRQSLVSKKFTVNFYPNVAGTYYGIFLSTNGINAYAAGRFTMTVSRTGSFSMSTVLPFRTYHVSGSLGTFGSASYTSEGFDGYPFQSGFSVDLTKGTETVSGYVYSFGVVSDMVGYRAVTKLSAATVPSAGDYVFNLQTATNQIAGGPTNDGYATLSVASTGRLNLSGILSDKTAFSEAIGVSKDGVWPFYAGLYQGRGLLIGWATNQASGGAAGTFYWVKPPTRDIYYTNGLALQGNITGTNYTPPAGGSQYQIVFSQIVLSGGSISPAVTIPVSVTGNGQFAASPGAAGNLKISLSKAGVLTGQFFDSASDKTLLFKGAFSSPSQGGAGFVLDAGAQTGSFEISLVPGG